MNKITFQIAAIAANESIINEMSRLAIEAEMVSHNSAGSNSKPVMETKGKAKPAKTDAPATETDDDVVVTMAEFKKAAKQVKAEHGEDFALQVIKDLDIKTGTTLGRTVSKVDGDSYQTIMDAWSAGPVESDELDDDDGLDDDLGEDEEVDAEAVKMALKAYSKNTGRKEAKEIMTEFGCGSLTDVGELSNEDLSNMLAKLA